MTKWLCSCLGSVYQWIKMKFTLNWNGVDFLKKKNKNGQH